VKGKGKKEVWRSRTSKKRKKKKKKKKSDARIYFGSKEKMTRLRHGLGQEGEKSHFWCEPGKG